MIDSSFYGWYFFLWSFHIWYTVISKTCYIFSAIFSFALLQSSCYSLCVYLTLSCKTINVTETNPILIHYRNIPHLNILPKYIFIWDLVTTVSAGAINSRRRNSYTSRRAGKKKSVQQISSEKVSQCQKLSHGVENESFHIFIL